MNETITLVLQAAVALIALVVAQYVIPYLNKSVDAAKVAEMEKWANRAVRWAQDWLAAKSGEERRMTVISALKAINEEKHLGITDEQIDILVRSAYTVMIEEMAKTYGTEDY